MRTTIKSTDDLFWSEQDKPKVQKLSIAPDEYLILRFPDHTSQNAMQNFVDGLKSKLKTDRIIGYIGDISFAKIQLQEEIIDKMLLGGQIKP